MSARGPRRQPFASRANDFQGLKTCWIGEIEEFLPGKD